PRAAGARLPTSTVGARSWYLRLRAANPEADPPTPSADPHEQAAPPPRPPPHPPSRFALRRTRAGEGALAPCPGSSHHGRICAVTRAPSETATEQTVTMRDTNLLIIALIGIGAACAPAAAAAQDDAALVGTYTQKHACKGDGSNTPKDLVKVTDTMADSNFGPCTFGGDKAWSGKTLKATATCK